MSGRKFIATDLASDFLSDTVTHQIECSTKQAVDRYNAYYFFSNGKKRFREAERYTVRDNGSTNKINLSKNSLTSRLDFIGVTIPIRANGTINDTTFFFKVDPKRNTIEAVDGDLFIKEIDSQYVPKN
ncbi:MAG: hypothetical protein K2H64_04715 [Desulfovibrio sp.]|nr:hypothetical protein [Desulfovibrio sp.]